MKIYICAFSLFLSLPSVASGLSTEAEVVKFTEKVMKLVSDNEYDKAAKEVQAVYIDRENLAGVQNLFNQIRDLEKTDTLGKKLDVVFVRVCKNQDFFFNVKYIIKFQKFFRPMALSFYSPNGKDFKVSNLDYGDKAIVSDMFCERKL